MLKKDKYDGFFSGLYKRNETFLVISTTIFLVSMFVGYAFSGALDSFLSLVLSDFKKRFTEGQLKLTTLSILTNNLYVAVVIYFGGLIFGIGTFVYLAFNGLFLGYAATQYPLGNFIIFTIPHGVFEVIGIIIAGAAGFRLTSWIVNVLKDMLHIRSDISTVTQMKYVFETHMDEIWESLKLFAIAVVLLIIAAVIEANLSIAWGTYIQSVL
ncbi:stage II sporulation protein M [Methanobacterium aggregans]|uniref:stage II sporulation protein M n=1 Tax=Methanobacterium aggregans TaxID=1615586 RepID=UPI001AE44750|nr:stage II sporulation protein M [Methanobacterium aggregans]MBP2046590.1 putative membrane protein SpoIIM required for sporulation [Methanobacterium aggregans]